MLRSIVVFMLFVVMPIGFGVMAQDDAVCDDMFVESQLALMTDAESYPVFEDDETALDDESLMQLAEQEVDAYCDMEREPLIDGVLGVPIETWFVSDSFADTAAETANEVEDDSDCVVGFLYVDHTHGTTFDIHAFCDQNDDGDITITTILIDEEIRLIVRYDPETDYDLLQLTNQQLTDFNLPITPFWHHLYTSPEYDLTRSIRDLDPIRFPGFPDDIEFYLFDSEKPDLPTELIFGRLEQQLSPPEFYAVELLNQPFNDYGVNVGDLVVVQLLEYEGEQIAVFITTLD